MISPSHSDLERERFPRFSMPWLNHRVDEASPPIRLWRKSSPAFGGEPCFDRHSKTNRDDDLSGLESLPCEHDLFSSHRTEGRLGELEVYKRSRR